MSNVLLFRDIQDELSKYLDANGFSGKNIYIDPSNAPEEPWIFIDFKESNDLSFSNNIDVVHNMDLIVTAQIYNTGIDDTVNEESGDYMYEDMNNLYSAIKDWFCRIDVVTYPFSKRVFGSRIKVKNISWTPSGSTQVTRAMMFEINFKYTD